MNILVNKIDYLHTQIFDLFENSCKKNKKIEWKLNRLNWYKNRYVFYFLFITKSISKKLLYFLNSIGNLDINLIKSWRSFEFRNVCSFKFKTALKEHTAQRCFYFSGKLLIVHRLNSGHFMGCVFCNSMPILNGPVWWDEYKKVQSTVYAKLYGIDLRFVILWCTILKIFSTQFKYIYLELNSMNFNFRIKKTKADLNKINFFWFFGFLNFCTICKVIKNKVSVCIYNYFLY